MKITIFANSYWNLYNFRLNFINYLIENKLEIDLIAPNDKYSKYFENIKCKVHYLDIKQNNISIFSDLKLCIQLFKILKKINPDLILLYTVKPNLYGSIISRILNIKYINTVTGLGTLALKGKILRIALYLIYKLSFINSKHIFFQNSYDEKFFFKAKKNNVTVVPGSGINLKKFKHIKKEFNIEKLKFLFVGRLIKEKGLIELLKSFELILKNYKNVSLDIIGNLDEKNKASISRTFINHYKNINNINFLGHIDDLEKKYKKYDCLILPSYREGCSRSILEAGASGLPVITNDVPGCNNIITDEYNGLIARPKSVSSLYKTIEKFIKKDRETFLKMKNNSIENITKNFDEKFVFASYLEKINQ